MRSRKVGSDSFFGESVPAISYSMRFGLGSSPPSSVDRSISKRSNSVTRFSVHYTVEFGSTNFSIPQHISMYPDPRPSPHLVPAPVVDIPPAQLPMRKHISRFVYSNMSYVAATVYCDCDIQACPRSRPRIIVDSEREYFNMQHTVLCHCHSLVLPDYVAVLYTPDHSLALVPAFHRLSLGHPVSHSIYWRALHVFPSTR